MNLKLAYQIANPALRRAVRTFFQAFLGILVGSQVFTTTASSGTIDIDAIQKLLVSACGAGVVAVVTWAWNAFEDSTGKSIAVEKHTP